jgi:threonine dehydratase
VLRHSVVAPPRGRRSTVAAGTATLGEEFIRQVPGLDAVIVPIGGGGLCAGVATAVKLLAPGCRVIGVEPAGADTMHRSFQAGQVQAIERVATIADSLGAPFAMPVSFELCRQHVDELVRVEDAELRDAMRLIHRTLGLAVEPACAASTAALLGPLAGRLDHARIGLVFCGSNIDVASFARLTEGGAVT